MKQEKEEIRKREAVEIIKQRPEIIEQELERMR